jgi:hypothetical protein
MDIAKIREFVATHKTGGLSEKDVGALVAIVAREPGKLTKTEMRELKRIGAEYASLFTKPGRALFAKYTGQKPDVSVAKSGRAGGASAVDVRAGQLASVPRAWEPIAHVAQKMSQLVKDGESVNLRLRSGRLISLEASQEMAAFIKKGYFKLYKNEKDSSEFDDDGHKIWYAAYYLVPTPAFKMLDDQVEMFATRADGITKAISAELEKLHQTMHASRVNGLQPFDLPQIKADVRAEIPKAKAAIIAYEQAVGQFAHDTQLLDYPNGEVYLMDFAKKALNIVGPHIEEVSLRDLDFTKDLIRANELLLTRPEVESVDPGAGIRICVNTDTLVQNGGDYNRWKTEITQFLRDQLITGELSIEMNNNWNKVLTSAQELLQKAVGKTNVRDGNGMGDKDFPDHVRGLEVTLHVKTAVLAEAQKQIPALRALFAPHGMDLSHFDLKIEPYL